jgi:hypothetical protein
VINLLSSETINSNGLLHFVGHRGELIHYLKTPCKVNLLMSSEEDG